MQLHPENDQRPWGMFRLFVKNTPSTVKFIAINNGGILSLQYHQKRDEFWRILSGHPKVEIDGVVTIAQKGDEFTIPATKPHRISAPTDDVEFIEIATGEFFDEEDIVRIEDSYGRK